MGPYTGKARRCKRDGGEGGRAAAKGSRARWGESGADGRGGGGVAEGRVAGQGGRRSGGVVVGATAGGRAQGAGAGRDGRSDVAGADTKGLGDRPRGVAPFRAALADCAGAFGSPDDRVAGHSERGIFAAPAALPVARQCADRQCADMALRHDLPALLRAARPARRGQVSRKGRNRPASAPGGSRIRRYIVPRAGRCHRGHTSARRCPDHR